MSPLRHILLIDDSLDDCEFFEYAIKKNGYEIDLAYAADCETAMKQLVTATLPVPDLIVLDWRMPGLSGIDCLKAIRNVQRAVATPLIVLSGTVSPDDMQKAQNFNTLCFLPKPYGPKEYDTTIRQIMTLTCNDG